MKYLVLALGLISFQPAFASQGLADRHEDHAQVVRDQAMWADIDMWDSRAGAIDANMFAQLARPDCTDPTFLASGDANYDYAVNAWDLGVEQEQFADTMTVQGEGFLSAGDTQYAAGNYVGAAALYFNAISRFTSAKSFFEAAKVHYDNAIQGFMMAESDYINGQGEPETP